MSESPTHILELALRDFIVTFGASLDPRLWAKLIKEELQECSEAAMGDDKAAYLKEVADLAYVATGFNVVVHEEVPVSLEEAKEWYALMRDVMAEITMAEEVFTPKVTVEAFRRVHLSNMSKLGDDGKPVKRDDGKIMKGPNYQPPVLDDLVSG